MDCACRERLFLIKQWNEWMQFSFCLISDVNHTGEGVCGILNFEMCIVHSREILSLRNAIVYHTGVGDEFSLNTLKRRLRLAFELYYKYLSPGISLV